MVESFFPVLIISYLEAFRGAFNSPGYSYFRGFVWAFLFVQGRKCITNIARACFFLNKHVSGFERFLSAYKWSIDEVAASLVTLLLRNIGDGLWVHGALLLGLDTTFKRTNSRKMIGVQFWEDHSGNSERGGRIFGHHWGIIGLIAHRAERYLFSPVLSRLISGRLNPACYIATPEGAIPMTFWDSVLALVLQMKTLLSNIPVRIVADAYFAKAAFIQPLIDTGIHVISRMRRDAVGWDDPPEYSGSGRPRKYGKQWKLANLLKELKPEFVTVTIYGKTSRVAAVTRDVWLRNINKKVRVVVVKGKKEPLSLLCTDLTLQAAQIIEIYAARFSIEIAIRDLKQNFGFCDYQCTSSQAILRFVQLCFVSFCLWRLMLLPENAVKWIGNDGHSTTNGPEPNFSFGRARHELRRFVLRQILFSKSPSDADFEKIKTKYEPLFQIFT